MLKGSFKSLWNRAVLFVGGVWLVLVFLVWETNQLATALDRQIFLAVVVCGFLFTYLSGFVIEARHKKKQAGR